nr:DarT ssDNA thymidine ADP-ribosyltransferase family protein [Pseudomonas sp.]
MSREELVREVERRGIREVLHFTTSNGLVGIARAGVLLSHSALPREKTLSYIAKVNCPDRSRDVEWHDYVNLSISRINASFFSICRDRWHVSEDIYWCILSFDPCIMFDEGVYFATTNNAYIATVRRAMGLQGLKALFAERVQVYPNKAAVRGANMRPDFTTCNQAEVLYPEGVSLGYLRKIYVPTEEHYHEATAQIAVCSTKLAAQVEILIAPEYFG